MDGGSHVGGFRPKIAFLEAQEDERSGRLRAASEKYAKIGGYLLRRGRYDEARRLLLRAIELEPSAHRVYLFLALCEARQKRDVAAKDWMKRFVTSSVRAHKAMRYLPLVESRLNDFPELREMFYEGLLQLDRTDAAPYLGLARALDEQGKAEAAQRVLVEALQTRTRRTDVVRALRSALEATNHMEGLYYLQRMEAGQISPQEFVLLLSDPRHAPKSLEPPAREDTLDAMIARLETELGLDPGGERDRIEPLIAEFRAGAEPCLEGDDKARIDMAIAYYVMGLAEIACEELRKIPSHSPHFCEALCLLGEMLFEQGSLLPALDVLQRCLREEAVGKDAAVAAKYQLMETYHRLGDVKRAWALSQQLVKEAPDFRDLKLLRSRMSRHLAAGSREKG